MFLRQKVNQNRNLQFIFYNFFFILVGFLVGNLCGSVFSSYQLSPFFFILSCVIFFELYSYVYYKIISFSTSKFDHPKGNQLLKLNLFLVKLPFLDFLYFLKVGIIFGLFVDAFKVGS